VTYRVAITVRKCIFLLGQHADVVACNSENLILVVTNLFTVSHRADCAMMRMVVS